MTGRRCRGPGDPEHLMASLLDPRAYFCYPSSGREFLPPSPRGHWAALELARAALHALHRFDSPPTLAILPPAVFPPRSSQCLTTFIDSKLSAIVRLGLAAPIRIRFAALASHAFIISVDHAGI
jgi:hypothetical protein